MHNNARTFQPSCPKHRNGSCGLTIAVCTLNVHAGLPPGNLLADLAELTALELLLRGLLHAQVEQLSLQRLNLRSVVVNCERNISYQK